MAYFVITIDGGFASQLRQFNIGQKIAQKKGLKLGIDISEYKKGYFRPYVLDLLQLPEHKVFSSEEDLKGFKKLDKLEKFINWMEGDFDYDVVTKVESPEYSAYLFKFPEYTEDSNSEIYSSFCLNRESNLIDFFEGLVKEKNSIGVHVRLGDFTTLGWDKEFEDYKARIGYLLKQNPDSNVFFFSNEIEKVEREFGNHKNFFFFNHHNGYFGDIEEFVCLAMCKEKVGFAKSGYIRCAEYLGRRKYNTNGIVDINSEQIKEGIEFFEKFLAQDGKNTTDFHELGDIVPKEIRVDVVEWNAECFTKEFTAEYWRKYYGMEPDENACYVVNSYDAYNRWSPSGKYEEAVRLSKMGASVLYINRLCKNSQGMVRNSIVPALNMDNKPMGFDVYLSSRLGSVSTIIERWKSTNSLEFKKTEIRSDSFGIVIYRIIRSLFNRING